ncbi:MAG TPA: pitrilysin family protein [Thermomicrobiaceae bacterium]|nr:pitrilysin family protein [Thermomicrobiaceae bacterium]
MYDKTTLPNGVRIVTSRMEHVRSATLILYYRAGSRYETDAEAGISHFLEHMVFKGTERRPDPAMLTQEIEGVGGIVNAATSRESTNYWVKVPSGHLERAFDVLADMLRNSLFDPSEVEKERGVIFEEIRGINDTPDDLIHDVIDEVVWEGQPVGRPVIGWEATVGAVTGDDLRRYLDAQYRPERLVVAAAGDVHHDEVVELADRYFGDLEPGLVNGFVPAAVQQSAPRLRLVERSTEQAHVCLAVPALPYTDERRYTQEMIDAVLSSGMSSRLFLEIRERLGLVYEVYSYFREYADVGQGVVYAGTDLQRVDRTIEAVLREFDRLRQEPVPADELDRTKELRKGRIVMGLEDSRSVAGWIGGQELVFGEILTPEQVMEHIDSVTSADIQALAQEIFRPDLLSLAVVGPYDSDERFRALLKL